MLKIKDRYISTDNIKETYIKEDYDWDSGSGKYVSGLIIKYLDNTRIAFVCSKEEAKPLFNYLDTLLEKIEE